MGRVSNEFKNLTKPVLQFLIQKEATAKNLKACRRVLESILRSRASEKKNRYKQELDNMFQNLCVALQDKQDLKKKLEEEGKSYERLGRKYSELSDRYFRLLTKIKTSKN